MKKLPSSMAGQIHSDMIALREALDKGGRTEINALLQQYERLWSMMRKEIEEIARKPATSPETMSRIAELSRQVETELKKYQELSAALAQEAAKKYADRALVDIASIVKKYAPEERAALEVAFAQLPTSALVSTQVIDQALNMPQDVAQAVMDQVRLGLALGEGPRAVASRVRKELGLSLSRSMRIVRTESLRAYREASQALYAKMPNLVPGWRWAASKSARTCAACLALDGTFHDYWEHMDDHPNGRCVMVPMLSGTPEADPNAPAPWETGTQWFAKQKPEIQRQVLGGPAYEAYRDKRVELRDFVGIRYSMLWGSTKGVRSLKEILPPSAYKEYQQLARLFAPERQKKIAEAIARAKNGTVYSMFHGEVGGSAAYGVPIFPDIEKTWKSPTLSPERILTQMNREPYATLLRDDRIVLVTRYEGGQSRLGLHLVVPDKDLALKVGRMYERPAILDLKDMSEIAAGGSGVMPSSAPRPLQRLEALFGPRVRGQPPVSSTLLQTTLKGQPMAQASREEVERVFTTMQSIVDEYKAAQQQYAEAEQQFVAFFDTDKEKASQARRLAHEAKVQQRELAEQARRAIASPDPLKVQFQLDNIAEPRATTIRQAIDTFRSLVSDKVFHNLQAPTIRESFRGRSSYDSWHRNVEIDVLDNATLAVPHELGHWLESEGMLHGACHRFLMSRIAPGEKPVSLRALTGLGYASHEKAYKDKFQNPYCGKLYDDATEILSMGLERVVEDPIEFFVEDEEYFRFIISVIRGRIRL